MFRDATMRDSLPKRSGSTVQWFRYGVLAANTTARTTAGGPGTATEGQIGSGTTLTSAVITATVAQYTDYIALSDFARDVHIDDTLKAAANNLGYRAGLSVDTVVRTEIDSGSTSMTTIGTNFGAKDAAQAFFALQAVDVSPMSAGKAKGYMYGIMSPYVAYDLINDPAAGGFLDIMKYSKPDTFDNYDDRNFIATIHGVKFYASNNIKVTAGTPNNYRVYVFGDEAVGSVDLEGKGPSDTTDQKVKPFAIKTVEGGASIADPEGVIGGIASYNFSFVNKILQTSPYRYKWFDAVSSIG